MAGAPKAWRRARAALRAQTGVRAGAILFLAGAVSVLGFAPFHVQPAYLIALCLLVLMLDDARRSPAPLKGGFWRAWCFAAGAFLAGTFWVANAFLERGGVYAGFFWVPLIAMPSGLALFWGVAGALYARLSRPGPGRVVTFAALFTAVEFARASWLSGFPWNLPGHVWEAGGAVSQAASLVGTMGLSAATLLILASPAALDGSGSRAARALPPVFGVLALAGLIGFGELRLARTPVEETGYAVRVVKLGIAQSERRYENRHAMLEAYLELSAAPGLDRIDAVIWPEGALPALTLREPDLIDRMAGVLPGETLILGATRAETGALPYLYYNALAVLDFTAQGPVLAATYDKTRLVPFGEGNPIRPLTEIFGFQSLSTNSPFLSPGSGAARIALGGLPVFAPLICYEVIYSGYVREAASEAAWLLNISNDSWYGASTGPYQHYNIARYRAIETGLPLVRAASAGVSGLVDPLGRGLQLSGLKSSEALDIPILAAADKPFYANRGDSPWVTALGLVLLLVHVLPLGRRRRRSAR
ncbi:apolipoprotein N-acyltransferase [Marinicauda algicola]|uniref:Apolipoprotein N-acyltransferase n=1 Tax=Marinicauda algicola TaxID=2029849 RepID=A0A4V3RY68_9PROT|nr:apolipoprotein N-acyltransferase [Marinicauda algicola]TGY89059.1 apolipoprotein N-acyltransferase [Marinicauda algicola]